MSTLKGFIAPKIPIPNNSGFNNSQKNSLTDPRVYSKPSVSMKADDTIDYTIKSENKAIIY
jgi:hypothetical protein